MKDKEIRKIIEKVFDEENKKDNFYITLYSCLGMILVTMIFGLLFPDYASNRIFLGAVMVVGMFLGYYVYAKFFLRTRTEKKLKKSINEIIKIVKKK